MPWERRGRGRSLKLSREAGRVTKPNLPLHRRQPERPRPLEHGVHRVTERPVRPERDNVELVVEVVGKPGDAVPRVLHEDALPGIQTRAALAAATDDCDSGMALIVAASHACAAEVTHPVAMRVNYTEVSHSPQRSPYCAFPTPP